MRGNAIEICKRGRRAIRANVIRETRVSITLFAVASERACAHVDSSSLGSSRNIGIVTRADTRFSREDSRNPFNRLEVKSLFSVFIFSDLRRGERTGARSYVDVRTRLKCQARRRSVHICSRRVHFCSAKKPRDAQTFSTLAA